MPDFFNDGNTPHRQDTLWKIEQKILGAILAGGGGGGGGTTYLTGNGSPVGVVTPTFIGQLYTRNDIAEVWKSTGLTNADWIQIS